MAISEQFHAVPDMNSHKDGEAEKSPIKTRAEAPSGAVERCLFEKTHPDLDAIADSQVKLLVADIDARTALWKWPATQWEIVGSGRKHLYSGWFRLETPGQLGALWDKTRRHRLITFVGSKNPRQGFVTPDTLRLFRVITDMVGAREQYDDIDWNILREDLRQKFGEHRIAASIPPAPRQRIVVVKRERQRLGVSYGGLLEAVKEEEMLDHIIDRMNLMKELSIHKDPNVKQGKILARYDRERIERMIERLGGMYLIDIREDKDEELADIGQLLYISMYARWAVTFGVPLDPKENPSKDVEDQVLSHEMRSVLEVILKHMEEYPEVENLRDYHNALRKWAVENPRLSAHITPKYRT